MESGGGGRDGRGVCRRNGGESSAGGGGGVHSNWEGGGENVGHAYLRKPLPAAEDGEHNGSPSERNHSRRSVVSD